MPFVNENQLSAALTRLKGTADHMLKVWFTLKQMGLRSGKRVEINTQNSKNALDRLFGFGDPKGDFFVPFGQSDRFMTMKHDASRSIIQTTIQRWAVSGSVVNADPTEYLDCERDAKQVLSVGFGKHYPQGLGFGKKGFALDEDTRVAIPDLAFAYWYFRQVDLPDDKEAVLDKLYHELFISPAEKVTVFVADQTDHNLSATTALSDEKVNRVVHSFLTTKNAHVNVPISEDHARYTTRIQSMITDINLPEWLRDDPSKVLDELLTSGAKAVLLYGPPRTGKTRFIDGKIARTDPKRVTIQIHDGWGYDELVTGFRPDGDNGWSWKAGPLLSAIRGGKTFIVLEEINRTQFTQAIGEVFSLIEQSYRGEANAIILRDGSPFFIPDDVVIIATMNTLDKSTEELDDAVFGRLAAVEFPPRVEELNSMLEGKGIIEEQRSKYAELFATIKSHYPLGHGYFSEVSAETNPLTYYKTRVRPVLQSHLSGYRDNDLKLIDLKVDELFA